MPGRPGLAAKSGQRIFDALEYRELFLSKLREGHGRKESAELVGVAYSTVWRYCTENPKFLDQIRDAEAERVSLAFKFFEKVMNDEEVPMKDRISAADKLAKYLARDQKADHKVVDHHHTHELTVGGDQIARVLQIQHDLAERKALDAVTIETTGEEI